MDDKQRKTTIDIEKYKKIIKSISIDKWLLIGAAGLVLIWCSDSCSGGDSQSGLNNSGYSSDASKDKSDNAGDDTGIKMDLDEYTDMLEDELKDMLMAIDGAGAVKVMITLKGTSVKEVLMEEPYSEHSNIESDSEGGSRDTLEVTRDYRVVYEENSNGDTVPFVVAEIYPEVEGVAVIAEGGDSAIVKEKITSIIKALFGIEINKIAVGKMK